MSLRAEGSMGRRGSKRGLPSSVVHAEGDHRDVAFCGSVTGKVVDAISGVTVTCPRCVRLLEALRLAAPEEGWD